MPPMVVSMTGPKTPKTLKTNAYESSAAANHEPNQNIQVFVRCRPLTDKEKRNVIEVVSDRKEIRVNERGTSVITDRFAAKTFTYDNVFSTETTQIEVYKSVVAPLIEQVVMGYNCTVFAYGQTGTGKTYTMEGERSTDESCSWEDDPQCGIIPRALHQLFETLNSQNTEHTVRVSFLELYNEELYDLLSSIDDTTKLKIFEDATRKGSIIVGGLEELTVHSKAEIYDVLKKGSAKRQTASTLLNACSSRSHTIFSVTVHIKECSLDGEEFVKTGKLNLVDLAGSENIGRSGAIDKRAREAGNINQSLLTLGRVITALVEKAPHIPYRESKLTRLLQDSLGGRTKTSIIATISPNIADVEDTLSTLDYAHRAKKITNKPEINQKMSKKTLLREYTAEIERLRRDLNACREKTGFFINEDNFNEMQQKIKTQMEEIEEKCSLINALKDEVSKVTVLFEETKDELKMTFDKLDNTNKTLHATAVELDNTQKTLHKTTVDCNEQKHLVNTHVVNEKLLSAQAKQLLAVADETTDNVHKLHEKVERQKNVEITNKTKIEDFQKTFENEMTKLDSLISVTAGNYHDSLEEMQNVVLEKFKGIETVITDIKDNASVIGNTFDNRIENVSSLHTKDRITLEHAIQLRDKTESLSFKSVENLYDLTNVIKNANESLQSQFELITSIVIQQRNDIEEMVMKQNEHINKQNELRMTILSGVKNQLQNVFDSQKSEIVLYKNQIEHLKGEHIESNQLISQKWDHLEKAMKEIKVLQIKENVTFEKNISQLKSKIEMSANHNDGQRVEIMSTIDEYSETIGKESKHAIDNNDEIDTIMIKHTQNIMDQFNVAQFKSNESFDTIKKSIDVQKEQMSNDIREMIEQNDDIIKLSDKHLNEKRAAMDNMKEEISHQLMAQNELIGKAQNGLKEVSDAVPEKTKEMIRMGSTMEQSHHREIENRTQSFDRFIKYELIKDIPTGMTPQRTEYQYDRNLVETSPHERILRRFRSALDPNEAINTPLPEESDSEFASINSSTSLDTTGGNGNIENIPTPKIPRSKNTSKERIAKGKSKKNDCDGTFVVEKKPFKETSKVINNSKTFPLKTANIN